MAFSYAPVLSRDIRGRLFRPPSTVRRFTIGEASPSPPDKMLPLQWQPATQAALIPLAAVRRIFGPLLLLHW